MKELFEAKERYVERKNKENMENDNLTDEQHFLIQDICKLRHEMHSNIRSAFMGSCNYEYELLEKLENQEILKFKCNYSSDGLDELPIADDYYNLLDEEEREEYEDGLAQWMEESGEYERYSNAINEIDRSVINWLTKIDKKYGTNYAPTGWARMQ